jgi:hypothetical protein
MILYEVTSQIVYTCRSVVRDLLTAFYRSFSDRQTYIPIRPLSPGIFATMIITLIGYVAKVCFLKRRHSGPEDMCCFRATLPLQDARISGCISVNVNVNVHTPLIVMKQSEHEYLLR